jgi:hypothetical protein
MTIEVDCHAHPFDGEDDYLTLVGVAETYGVLIEELPAHPHHGWAWWYRVTGPADNLRRFLVEEYYGEDTDLIDGMLT